MSLLALAFSLYLAICLVFHYTMACIVSPGSTLDLSFSDNSPSRQAFQPFGCISRFSHWFGLGTRSRTGRQRTIAAMKAAARSGSLQSNSRLNVVHSGAKLSTSALELPDNPTRASSSRASSTHSSTRGISQRRCAKCLANGMPGPDGLGPLKPERAHHCRVCGVCWLKYDHQSVISISHGDG